MLEIKRFIVFTVLLLMVVISNAQQSKVAEAFTFLQQGKLDSAKANIESAIVNTETKSDGQAWYCRGFIYKSIYNKLEKSNTQSPARLEALKSFKKSIALDTTKENVFENIKNIKYLATTLYNDVAATLDTVNYKISIIDFNIFREYYLIVDSSKLNFKIKEIDFFNAVATVYSQFYNAGGKEKNRFLELAKKTYLEVLHLDPDNINANYNMGILYYNQAVNLINQSAYDIDIVALNKIQDNSIRLFKASLPFMEKAYALDPYKKETLQGLSGIYYGLNENEKSEEFKNKLEQIKK